MSRRRRSSASSGSTGALLPRLFFHDKLNQRVCLRRRNVQPAKVDSPDYCFPLAWLEEIGILLAAINADPTDAASAIPALLLGNAVSTTAGGRGRGDQLVGKNRRNSIARLHHLRWGVTWALPTTTSSRMCPRQRGRTNGAFRARISSDASRLLYEPRSTLLAAPAKRLRTPVVSRRNAGQCPGLVLLRDDLMVEWCMLLVNQLGQICPKARWSCLRKTQCKSPAQWEGGEGLEALGQWASARTLHWDGQSAAVEGRSGRRAGIFYRCRTLPGALPTLGEAEAHLLANPKRVALLDRTWRHAQRTTPPMRRSGT